MLDLRVLQTRLLQSYKIFMRDKQIVPVKVNKRLVPIFLSVRLGLLRLEICVICMISHDILGASRDIHFR